MSEHKLKSLCEEYSKVEESLDARCWEIIKEENLTLCPDCPDEFAHDCDYYRDENTDAPFDVISESDSKIQDLVKERERLSQEILIYCCQMKDVIISDSDLYKYSGVINKIHNFTLYFSKDYNFIKPFLELKFYSELDNFVDRVVSIRPFLMNARVNPHAKRMYLQIINNYIHGHFDACCVLSRSLVEAVAKRYIIHAGYKELLVGNKKDEKFLTIPAILKNYFQVPDHIIKLFREINQTADEVLHDERLIKKEDAEKLIKQIVSFLQEFSKPLV